MRPASIVNFERVVLLSLGLGILNTFLVWDRTAAALRAADLPGLGTNMILITQAVTIALYLLLIWFIARKGSPVAKWIYIVLSVIGFVFGLIGFKNTFAFGTGPVIIAALQYLISIYAIWLLFRPDAKSWFSDGRGDVDPDVFN